jgi:predicted nuclease with RNAse H fold
MRSLGIDLAGCMSGNGAYILVEWTEEKARIISMSKEPKHKNHTECFSYLKNELVNTSAEVIGIDAPFSLPACLQQQTGPLPEREGKGEILNPYLYRYTDYYLYHTYGLRPMPPAGDRIGRLSARMIELFHHFDYDMPLLHLPQGNIPTYELYPKQIALALGYTGYKKHQDKILEIFGIHETLDEHLFDALLASYGAWKISLGHTVHPPSDATHEGWCYPLTFD